MRAVAPIAFVALAALLPAEPYLTGGTRPLRPDVQAVLDRYQPLIGLGINADWMEKSGIDAEPFVLAVGMAADAAEKGEIPGAVIHADRFLSNTLPIPVGFKIVDPERRLAERETVYAVGDLTGPMVVAPLALQCIAAGKWQRTTTVASVFSELHLGPVGEVTAEQLLRHSSGIRANADTLQETVLMSVPGTLCFRHRANWKVLAMMLERTEGKPLEELAKERLFSLVPDLERLGWSEPREQLAKLAPGGYSATLGRMWWGDPRPAHLGLLADADDAGLWARLVAPIATAAVPDSIRPDPAVAHGEGMGMGYAIGKFGPGSYGWDGDRGSSIWILPDGQGAVVFLSNFDHLPQDAMRSRAFEVRGTVTNLLGTALLRRSAPAPEPSPRP